MKKVLDDQDPHLLLQLERFGLDTPANMIDKFMFEKGPDWLSTLLVSAAQYHYNTACNFKTLSLHKDDKFRLSFTVSMLDRCRDSIYAIKDILGYVDDMIPEVILSCPASINDEKFLTE